MQTRLFSKIFCQSKNDVSLSVYGLVTLCVRFLICERFQDMIK